MNDALNDSIDLWHGRLTGGETIDQRFWRLLDDSERRHAHNLKRQNMQARYVEVHGKMRRILATYLQTEPDRILIGKEAHGKPYLLERPGWVFNLSHSAERFVLAVSKNCQLGADIERYKGRVNLTGLVKKCFAHEERVYWEALPEPDKIREFYRFWTRKEAFVKATGRGIALGLEQCVINPLNPSEMLRMPENCDRESEWRIADIDLADGFACAVANDKGLINITLRETDDEWGKTL
ncbi:MAG: 4'-phosphopantetheinyl transferase family protein [Gammaproteobacteria bacterium]